MSGEIEAAGALATAGLAAGAIERGGDHGVDADGVCANCGAAVSGRYCASCGQPVHVHRSLGHFFEEVLHGLFHFDTKAWRTLPMIAFRPGTLTRSYIYGKRARYISPIAMFLFVVFLMFLVFAFVGETPSVRDAPLTPAQAQAEVASARGAVAKAQAVVTEAQSKLDAATFAGETDAEKLANLREALSEAQGELKDARGEEAAAVDAAMTKAQRIARIKQVMAQLNVNEAKARAEDNKDDLADIATSRAVLERALLAKDGPSRAVRASVKGNGDVAVNVNATTSGGLDAIFEQIKAEEAAGRIKVNTPFPAWDKKIHDKLKNPELAWYKIQNTAYKFSFLLVPLSLPFIWLMFFWKRGVTLFDHTVFALYSLSFMSLLFVIIALATHAPKFVGETLTGLTIFAMPVHMFFHLKGTYALGWFSALWRTFFLMLSACIALALFIAVIFTLGLLG